MKLFSKYKINSLLICFFAQSGIALANNTMSSVVAKVSDVGIYGDGSMYVFFDRQISSCSSSSFRLDLEPDHPAINKVYSAALAALASGKDVKVLPKLCDGNKSRLSRGKDSFFYIIK